MHDDINPNSAPWRLMLSKFVDMAIKSRNS